MQIHAPKQLSKCSNPSAKSNFGAERVMTRNIVTVEEISAWIISSGKRVSVCSKKSVTEGGKIFQQILSNFTVRC